MSALATDFLAGLFDAGLNVRVEEQAYPLDHSRGVGVEAGGEIICRSCADETVDRPRCTICGAVARTWAMLGRAHKACGVISRFLAVDHQREPVKAVSWHALDDGAECALCGAMMKEA